MKKQNKSCRTLNRADNDDTNGNLDVECVTKDENFQSEVKLRINVNQDHVRALICNLRRGKAFAP